PLVRDGLLRAEGLREQAHPELLEQPVDLAHGGIRATAGGELRPLRLPVLREVPDLPGEPFVAARIGGQLVQADRVGLEVAAQIGEVRDAGAGDEPVPQQRVRVLADLRELGEHGQRGRAGGLLVLLRAWARRASYSAAVRTSAVPARCTVAAREASASSAAVEA